MATAEADLHPHSADPASTHAPQAADAGAVDHSADHGETPLGPVDWGAWLLSGAGVGAGALIALVLLVAGQHG